MFAQNDAFLPQISISGELKEEYSYGTMKVTMGNETIGNFNIKLKIRGGTSRMYLKKSISIKLLDQNGESMDFSFFGMRSDNNWILDAMTIDMARMRNRLAFDLWNDFSTPSYINKEYNAESLNGIRGTFVELYFNDDYRGIYCLNEKIDRKQLKLKKYKDEEIKGILYKAESWNGTIYWDYEKDYDNENDKWMGWSCQYPELDDNEKIDWTPLIDNIDFVVNSTKEEFTSEVGQRFDIPVLIDYIIFYTFINAEDNYGKNQYAYFYNINKDLHQGLAPWDLDATFGRTYNSDKTSVNSIPSDNKLYKRLNNEYPDFSNILQERYAQWRSSGFTSKEIIKRIDNYYYNNYEALKKETQRWNNIDGFTLDFATEMQYLKDWINCRFVFMDNYYNYVENGIETTTCQYNGENGRIYNLLGQRINNCQKGFYVLNGKKYIK